MRRRSLAMGVLIGSALVLSLTATTFARSPAGSTVGSSVVITTAPDGSIVLVAPAPGLATKGAWNPAGDVSRAAVGSAHAAVSPLGCGWPSCNPATLSGSYVKSIVPPGGKAGNIKVQFSSRDSYAVPEFNVTFGGTSQAQWTGATPFNATEIVLSDHWNVSAILPSVGFPSGVGITGSGGDAFWSRTITKNWALYHTFSNIHFSALDIWQISEDSTADFSFSNHSWTIQAHDSALV